MMADGFAARMEVPVNVGSDSLALLDFVKLEGPEGLDLELPPLRLDTGCAVPMILPRRLLKSAPDEAWQDTLYGWSGTVRALVVPCTLAMRPWHMALEAWFIDTAEEHAWIGLPVLRHFDLLLRGEGPHGPVLRGPDPSQRINVR
jgi:hypothetical protein